MLKKEKFFYTLLSSVSSSYPPSSLSYVFIAGGTGGHIFPAIALAQGLKKNHHSLVFVTDHRGREFLKGYEDLFKEILLLKTPKNGSLFQRLLHWLFFFLGDFWSQRKLLKNFYNHHEPHVFMAFGGQFTFLPFLVAKEFFSHYPGKVSFLKNFCLRLWGQKKLWERKTYFFLQQSDAVLGVANKWLLPMADKIFTTFSLGLGDKEKTIGLPIREEFYNHLLSIKSSDSSPLSSSINLSVPRPSSCILCVLGGSQGAIFWISLLTQTFSLMTPQERSSFFVYHQCPENQQAALEKHYKKLSIPHVLKHFFHNLPHIMSSSSLILSRSGASTLGEICTLSKAALLVPYGFAKNNHQEKNAQYLVNQGGAWMIRQKDLTPEKLKDLLLKALHDPELLKTMGHSNHELMKESAVKIFLKDMKNLSF